MGLFQSLTGMVRVRLTTAASEILFEKLTARGIEIHDAVSVDDLTVEFTLGRKDYPELVALADRRGEDLHLIKKTGIYWPVVRLVKRPVLTFGLILLLLLGLYVPSRVFWIQVEGNEQIPHRMILEAAAESGIRFGASRREVVQ